MAELKKAAVLKYYRDMAGPILAEKGIGRKAERILKLAAEYDIPVVENDIVDHLMYMQRMSVIDEGIFELIADIYAFVLQGGHMEVKNGKDHLS